MSVYLVVSVTNHDPAWLEAYRRDVPAMVAAHGGRYVAYSRSPERIEGDGVTPDTLAILEFPSQAAVTALFASPEYRPHLLARQSGASTQIYGIEAAG